MPTIDSATVRATPAWLAAVPRFVCHGGEEVGRLLLVQRRALGDVDQSVYPGEGPSRPLPSSRSKPVSRANSDDLVTLAPRARAVSCRPIRPVAPAMAILHEDSLDTRISTIRDA